MSSSTVQDDEETPNQGHTQEQPTEQGSDVVMATATSMAGQGAKDQPPQTLFDAGK